MKEAETANDWLVWQLVDSAFPSGGFAHSGGLEAAWQHGEVRDAGDLASFAESYLWQIVSSMIPFVTAGHDAPGQIDEINFRCEACLTNHVANRASRLQGRAFLNSAARIYGKVVNFATVCDPCHFAPAFGAVTRALSLSRSAAAQLFLFQSLRAVVAAAVRLGIVGPMEAQSMQHRMAPRAREMLAATEDRGIEDVASTAPILEIWQGSQDRLYSRLFQT